MSSYRAPSLPAMNMRPLAVPAMVVMKVLSVGMEYSGSGSRCISPIPGSPAPPGKWYHTPVNKTYRHILTVPQPPTPDVETSKEDFWQRAKHAWLYLNYCRLKYVPLPPQKRRRRRQNLQAKQWTDNECMTQWMHLMANTHRQMSWKQCQHTSTNVMEAMWQRLLVPVLQKRRWFKRFRLQGQIFCLAYHHIIWRSWLLAGQCPQVWPGTTAAGCEAGRYLYIWIHIYTSNTVCTGNEDTCK